MEMVSSAAAEKSAEELRKEIEELKRQQWEITERLRDPRGIRRAGLSQKGPRPIQPRQRGLVRPIDRAELEDQPLPKKRLSSAVIKVGGEPEESATVVEKEGEALTVEVGQSSSYLRPFPFSISTPDRKQTQNPSPTKMLSSILPFPKTHLSSSISYSTHISKSPLLSTMITRHPSSTAIRMGGGPRTFPGGVSKWQWKRMQAKKAKQLLKARLCRERQIYEMRKRAELKAAVSELERPWEVVERSPNLFSIKADEQVKVLADRFHKVGGFDMWSENDGPVVFRNSADDGLPSARFFPKGVVHSVRPYGVEMEGEGEEVTGGGSRNKNLMRRRDNVSGLNPARPKGRLNPGSRLTGSKVENQNFDSEDVANEDNRRFRNGGRRRRAVVYRKPSTGTGGNSGKQSYGLRESEVIPTGRLNPGRGRLIGGKFQHLNSDSEDEANEDYQRIRNGGGRRRAVVERKPSPGTGGNRGKQSSGTWHRESEFCTNRGSVWDEDDLKAI